MEMKYENKNNLRRTLFILGKEYALDVAVYLCEHEWQSASEVARDLDLHVATAVKYLSEFFEIGLVNRRIKRGKTREVFEYRLKEQEKPKVEIEFDLSELQKIDETQEMEVIAGELEENGLLRDL